MEIIIQENINEASRLGALIVARQIASKPDSVLGLATGSTPLALYRQLIDLYDQKMIDFSRVTSFNLDEYVGLPPSHPSSYNSYMWQHLFNHINIRPHRTHLPDGMAPDIAEHCRQYEGVIKAAGGIDLQVLGIGADGHIGFNEPTSSLASRTRIKTLTEQTRQDNAPNFGSADKVPHHVITMGVGTIMESRLCLMLAFGTGKATAIREMVEGPITATVPASALQMHPRTIVITDGEAASELSRKDYYRWVYQNKPTWQRYD
jgi:glucosamine-6-phosphate deaminase